MLVSTLQRHVLYLDVSTLHRPELLLDVSTTGRVYCTPQGPELFLDVSTVHYTGLSCTWTTDVSVYMYIGKIVILFTDVNKLLMFFWTKVNMLWNLKISVKFALNTVCKCKIKKRLKFEEREKNVKYTFSEMT